MAERCPERRAAPPALGEPSRVPEPGQVLPQPTWGGRQRPRRGSNALGLSKHQAEKERKVGAAHRKKPLISDEGLGQLSHRVSLLRRRRSWLLSASTADPRCSSPTQPQRQRRRNGSARFACHRRTCEGEGRGVGSQRRNKNCPWQKAPVRAQRSPYLPDLQTIPELCSWNLSQDKSAGHPPRFCLGWPGSAPQLQPREPRSIAATDLHMQIVLLSKH